MCTGGDKFSSDRRRHKKLAAKTVYGCPNCCSCEPCSKRLQLTKDAEEQEEDDGREASADSRDRSRRKKRGFPDVSSVVVIL